MSQTELHSGKLIRVPKINDDETLPEMAERLIIQHQITTEDYTSNLEALLWDFYPHKYFIYNENLYECFDEVDEGGDIFKATINQDGSISYVLQYYNGGCSMSEAMDAALKHLNQVNP